MLGSFFAEHNLSFHAHSSKIGDPYDGSFLRVLGLHNSVLALHLQKKTDSSSFSLQNAPKIQSQST